MSGKYSGNDSGSITQEFERQRKQGVRPAQTQHTQPPAKKDDFQTGALEDCKHIGELFLLFIKSLFTLDFQQFDHWSNIYFPPKEDGAKESAERTESRGALASMNVIRDQKLKNPSLEITPEQLASIRIPHAENALRVGKPREALLDMIASVESSRQPNGGYDVVYGHRKVTYKGCERALTDMTVGEVMDWQKGQKLSAAGRYQFIGPTLAGLVKEHCIDTNRKFSPELQDQLGGYLLDRRGYNDFVSGKISLPQFMKNLSQEWASIPKDQSNLSYYHGDGLNKAGIKADTVEATLLAVKEAANREITGQPSELIVADASTGPSKPVTPGTRLGTNV